MYINAEDVKMYMNLDIHKQVADFLNKQIAESQTMYLEDLKDRLQELLNQEVIGDTVSDVGTGIELAIQETQKLINEFKEDIKNMYIVLKREDVSNYLSKSEQAALDEMIDRIIRGRKKDNKKPINSYYIVNVDEPYAEAVYDIITDGEKSKMLGMETINESVRLDN